VACFTVCNSPWSRRFHRSRSNDEDPRDPRATDSVSLLCHLLIASVAKHSSLHTDVRPQFSCFCTRTQQVGLKQQWQSPDRLACLSPVSPKCRSKAHFQPETLWSHHRRAHQPSLAPRAEANCIQSGDGPGDADVSCYAWLRTTFTWRRHSHVSPTCRTDAGSGSPTLNSLTFRPAVGQLSEVVPFLVLEQRCGIACQAQLRRPRRCRCSRTGWRHRPTCSAADSELHFFFLVIISPPWTVVLAIVFTV